MWIPFAYIGMLIFGLLFGIEMDVAHTEKTKVILQGAMDASTLAGALQNHVVVTGTDQFGAPTRYEWKLNDDSTPEAAAWDAWNKNLSFMNAGIGQNTIPQFQRTLDNKGMVGTVTQTVQPTISQHVMDTLFGPNSHPNNQVWVPATSISKVSP